MHRRMDRRRDMMNLVYAPTNFIEWGYNEVHIACIDRYTTNSWTSMFTNLQTNSAYGSGHEGGPVLLPGFAIIW